MKILEENAKEISDSLNSRVVLTAFLLGDLVEQRSVPYDRENEFCNKITNLVSRTIDKPYPVLDEVIAEYEEILNMP